jgi:hypothetical protein
MDQTTELLTGVAAAAVAALAAFAIYRWRQRERVRSVKTWVKTYVADHYDGTAANLRIDCSDDPLWPVLASFDNSRSGLRHRLEFTCCGRQSSYALVSEKKDAR